MSKRKTIEISQFLEALDNVRSDNRKAYKHIENARDSAKVSEMHKYLDNARRICKRTHENIVQIGENVRQISEKRNEPIARRTRSSSRAKRQKFDQESIESENQESSASKSFQPENSKEPLLDYQVALDDEEKIVIDTRAIETNSIELEQLLEENIDYQIGDRVNVTTNDGAKSLEIVNIFYSYGDASVHYYARDNQQSEMFHFTKDAIISRCTQEKVSQELNEHSIESSKHSHNELTRDNDNQNSNSQNEPIECQEKIESLQDEPNECRENIESLQDEALDCDENIEKSKHSQDELSSKQENNSENCRYQRILAQDKGAFRDFRKFLKPNYDNVAFGSRIGSHIRAIEKKTETPHSIIEEIVILKKNGLRSELLDFANATKFLEQCNICKTLRLVGELDYCGVRVCERCLGITRAYYHLSFTLLNLKDCSIRNFSDREIVYFLKEIGQNMDALEESMRE